MQKDLNMITISTVASNHALSNMLEMYNDGTYTPEKNKQRVKDWQASFECLAKAVDVFIKDTSRLEAYINGQR